LVFDIDFSDWSNLTDLKHEQQGYRPYICLSNKIISDTVNIAIFAPISNTKRQYPYWRGYQSI